MAGVRGGNNRGQDWRLGVNRLKPERVSDPMRALGRVYRVHVGSYSQQVTAEELLELARQIGLVVSGAGAAGVPYHGAGVDLSAIDGEDIE